MRFTVETQVFTEAVSVTARAVAARSGQPVLEGILLSAKDGAVTLTGYDLEMGITTTLPCALERQGKLVISAKMLMDISRRMAGDTITLDSDEKFLTTLTSGVTEYTVIGLSASDYPELPSVDPERTLSLPQGLLRSMIEQTLFAVSQATDMNPVHSGSRFLLKNETLTVISLNRYHLAVRYEPCRSDAGELDFVVPGRTLGELAKILEDNDEKQAMLALTRKHILFTVGDFRFFSRLLEGNFIDYTTTLPKTVNTTVELQTRSAIDAIERASLLINERVRSPLRLNITGGVMKMTCTTALGNAYDEVAVRQSGDDLEIGFNSRFILDALRAARSDVVKLELVGPLSPMKIVPVSGDSFLFLVLPVRLRA